MDLGPVYTLNGEALVKLAQRENSETVRVLDLIKAFFKLMSERKGNEPYLIPIGERAEQIAKAFYERQMSSQQALKELTTLAEEVKAAEAEQKATDLSHEGFAVYWYLKREGLEQVHPVAQALEEAIKEFPHWEWYPQHEKEVRIRLYRTLLEAGCKEGVVPLVDGILKLLCRQR